MSENQPQRGYFGKILWVDLSRGTAEIETVPDEIYEQFLGGYGLGVKILWDRQKPDVDPLAPDATLGFLPGLFTGTGAPFSGRFMVVGKSPLTGTWGDSNCGGYFGPAVRKCGIDGIFVTGASDKPVYLHFDGETPEILDAEEFWGQDTIESENALKEKHGRRAQVANIGPAGENLVRFAGVFNDKGRTAGRSGLGTVMGSKKLKAIVLTGKKKNPVRDRKTILELTKTYNKRINKKPGWLMRKLPKVIPKLAGLLRRLHVPLKGPASIVGNIYKTYGTSFANSVSSEIGDSPVKNWGGIGYVDFPQEKSRKIGGPALLPYKERAYGCASCPLRCGAILSAPGLGLEETHRPEYETCCMFGTLLLNDDLDSLLLINEMCNRGGVDSISAGSTIGFAIECFENGILAPEDTGGLELMWGNADAIKALLEKIIAREGLGDVLADGMEQAAKTIGKGADQYAIHAHGEALPAHDPKYTPSLALTYATDPTPGRHTAASVDFAEMGPIESYVEGLKLPKKRKKNATDKAIAQKRIVAVMQVLNSLGFCFFSTLLGPMPVFELLEAVTGWHWDLDDVIETGLRIQNLRLAFTLREGVNPVEIELPGRAIGEPPQEQGPNKDVTLDLGEMKREYYLQMGWDPETGVPADATLESLGLDYVVGKI